MNRTPFDTVDRLLVLVTVVVTVVVLIGWIVRAQFGELSWDAGYYVSLARLVRGGLVPHIGFPSAYPPGGYYLLALLNDGLLTDPTALRMLTLALHVVNASLFFMVLRMLGIRHLDAFLWSTICLLWTMQCGGPEPYLESFEVTFLLSGVLALLALQGPTAALLAGLALGCAVLVKQYSLLALPGFLLLISGQIPCTRNTGQLGDHMSRGARVPLVPDEPWPSWWTRTAVLTVAVAIPYVLFALLTRQPQPENLVHLATFGGRAFSSEAIHGQYYTHGLLNLVREVADGRTQFRLIATVLAAALLLILLRPSRTNLALVALFVVPLAQLYVRAYLHYIQLAIPWGIAIMAVVARIVGAGADNRIGDRNVRAAVVLIAVLPFLSLLTSTIYESRVTYLESKLSKQKALASEVLRAIPDRNSVIVLYGPWLYLLADLKPPGYDYTFLESPSSELVSSSEYVILFPFWSASFDDDRRRLVSSGFESIVEIPWRQRTVVVFRHKSPEFRSQGDNRRPD